jgi:hypothetical protein
LIFIQPPEDMPSAGAAQLRLDPVATRSAHAETLRAMKPKAEVIVLEYKWVVEI